LEKALNAVKHHCRGKLYCVFGCGGDRDRGKRPEMAAIAEQLSDFVVLTNDNPRTEDPERIIEDVMSGFASPYLVLVEKDREKAIRLAVSQAKPGDWVLVAGKGHEDYQDIQGVKHPFSDVEKVVQALVEYQS
jgi:UDP-N-acetylmuramoyl-L-alanyl-D-glutamate--2,6-diaminopimelate ligase